MFENFLDGERVLSFSSHASFACLLSASVLEPDGTSTFDFPSLVALGNRLIDAVLWIPSSSISANLDQILTTWYRSVRLGKSLVFRFESHAVRSR